MRHLMVGVSLLAASSILHAVLFLLGIRRIDPIVYVATRPNQLGTYPHAQLALSVTGLLTWVVVAAAFSFGIAALLKGAFKRPWWLYAMSVFLMTLAYMAIIHPHFLWVTFGAGARAILEASLRDTPLYSYYFGNGFFRFRIVLPFAYALLMYILLPLGGLRSNTRPALPGATP